MVRSLDPLHLVAVGGVGLGRDYASKEAAQRLGATLADPNVDVVTMQLWPQVVPPPRQPEQHDSKRHARDGT